jgi:hypothetical protein
VRLPDDGGERMLQRVGGHVGHATVAVAAPDASTTT